MDWQKAKTYTIIILTVFNLFLLVFNIAKDSEYYITADTKEAVIKILSRDGISVCCDIPSRFEPMRLLSVKQCNYDYFELQKIFFDSADNLKRTKEFEKTVFSNSEESMTIQGNEVYYENRKNDEKYSPSEKNAIKKCMPYINKIGRSYARFNISRTESYDDYYVIEFMQKFNDYDIFNNYALFYVFDSGAVAVEFMYSKPVDNKGTKTGICSADEALFAFCREVKKLYDDDTGIKIIKTDLGYYRPENAESTDDTTSQPYYRIVVDGFAEPCFVNAYTQEVIVY